MPRSVSTIVEVFSLAFFVYTTCMSFYLRNKMLIRIGLIVFRDNNWVSLSSYAILNISGFRTEPISLSLIWSLIAPR